MHPKTLVIYENEIPKLYTHNPWGAGKGHRRMENRE